MNLARMNKFFITYPREAGQIIHELLEKIKDGNSLSQKGENNYGSAFLFIEDPENESIICWDSHKTMIQIRNEKLFEDKVLIKHFRHNRISSFIRQLNLYGFKKIRSVKYRTFTHSVLEKGLGIEAISNKKRVNQINESHDLLDEESIKNEHHIIQKFTFETCRVSKRESDKDYRNELDINFWSEMPRLNNEETQSIGIIPATQIMNSYLVFPIEQTNWQFSDQTRQDSFISNFNFSAVPNWC